MEIFDPNSPMPDFQVQMLALARQRKMAEALREQKAQEIRQSDPGKGQMVGKFYVPPAMSQRLNRLLNQVGSGQGDRDLQANDAAMTALQAQYIQKMQEQNAGREQQAADWRSNLPQAIAAQQGTAPPDELGGGPPTAGIAAQPVTTDRILKHTLAGMQNPKTAVEAGMYQKTALGELEREDRQVEAAAMQKERLAQAAELARQRSEDMRLSIEQRAEAAREATQARLQIAAMTKAVAGSGKAEAATARKEAADDRSLERLGTKAALLSPLVNAAQQVQTLLDTNEGKSIPGVGYPGILPSVMLTKEGNVNKAKVKMFANAMLRNQAGLSQTLSETENAQLEMLANGKYSEAEFRASWPNLMEKVNASVMATRAGYDPEVVKTFEGRGGQIAPIKSSKVPKLTPQEEQELAALRARFPGGK